MRYKKYCNPYSDNYFTKCDNVKTNIANKIIRSDGPSYDEVMANIIAHDKNTHEGKRCNLNSPTNPVVDPITYRVDPKDLVKQDFMYTPGVFFSDVHPYNRPSESIQYPMVNRGDYKVPNPFDTLSLSCPYGPNNIPKDTNDIGPNYQNSQRLFGKNNVYSSLYSYRSVR
jgi:hypothetical protein